VLKIYGYLLSVSIRIGFICGLGNGVDILFQVIMIAIVCIIIMVMTKNFDSKSLLDNYKFEIKKAKDIS
jgi:hypothetical protein